MRDIIFKGKRKDNSEWVEGYLFDDGMVDSKRMFIGSLVITEHKGLGEDVWDIGHAFYEVLPETVGQYTGLTDKNGRKIFEGDICQIKGISYIDETPFIVEWNNEYSGWYWKNLDFGSATDVITPEIAEMSKVIGNIHDNPELLKGGA